MIIGLRNELLRSSPSFRGKSNIFMLATNMVLWRCITNLKSMGDKCQVESESTQQGPIPADGWRDGEREYLDLIISGGTSISFWLLKEFGGKKTPKECAYKCL